MKEPSPPPPARRPPSPGLHALSYMNYSACSLSGPAMANTLDTREISDLSGRADAAYAAEVGRMVRLGRAKRGMSRRQLAEESGTSERYLAQIESGAGNPSLLVMRAVADALELPIVELLPRPRSDRAAYARIIDLLGRVPAE